MLTELLVRSALGRATVLRLGAQRTRDIVGDVRPHLSRGDSIVDIGAGTCDVAAALRSDGFAVTPIDVRDLSCVPGLRPRLYDGRTLPFEARSFSVGLLSNVLHHVPDPEALLLEGARVARRLLVLEDVYDDDRGRRLTQLMDSALNLEFFGHPHSNRSDSEWRATFLRLGLRLVDARTKRFWRVFQGAVYVVDVP